MPAADDTHGWSGRTVIGSDGEKIGKVSQVYEDPARGGPEWATVSSGLFGNRTHFVPLAGARRDGEDVRVAFTHAQVKDARGVADEEELSHVEERRLFAHYGVSWGDEESTTARQAPPSGADASDRHDTWATTDRSDRAPAADTDALDRGRDRVPADHPQGGQRRLRRYVVTEITTTVPISDEETEIESGPADSTRR